MDDEPDVENPMVQTQMISDLFKSLEECDSKRVDDFWDEIDNTVLMILNPNLLK